MPREVVESPPLETARIRVESSSAPEGPASLSREQGRARAASLTPFPARQGMPEHPEPGQAAGNALPTGPWNSSPGGTFLQIIHPLLPQELLAGLCSAPPAHRSQSRMCSLGCLLRNHKNSQIRRHRKGSQPPQAQALPKGVFLELPRRSFLAAAPAHSASLSSSAGPGRKEFIQGKSK